MKKEIKINEEVIEKINAACEAVKKDRVTFINSEVKRLSADIHTTTVMHLGQSQDDEGNWFADVNHDDFGKIYVERDDLMGYTVEYKF